MNRRDLLKASAAAGASASLPRVAAGKVRRHQPRPCQSLLGRHCRVLLQVGRAPQRLLLQYVRREAA